MIKSTTTPLRKVLATAVMLLAATFVVFAAPMAAFADSFDEQIRQKQNEIASFQSEAGRLQSEADTLQNKISAINAQKSAIIAQIELSQAKHDQLKSQIAETEKKIDQTKEVLGTTLANLYVDSNVSSLEMIASSKSIGDYMDKQEYRTAIRDKLNDTIKKIRTLRQELTDQKIAVEKVLKDQEAQREQLAAQEAEQSRLLAETQGQEANYQNMISAKNSEIASLRAQQRAANSRFIGSAGTGPACGGGYPGIWCNIPMDTVVDNWGMYNRECVSYTAFKVAQSGRYMPYWGGRGNANQWDENAQAAGIPVDGNPRAGDIAISNAGYYGHAMYVESVNSNGTINISQYNADLRGNYSTNTISPAGLVFLHF